MQSPKEIPMPDFIIVLAIAGAFLLSLGFIKALERL